MKDNEKIFLIIYIGIGEVSMINVPTYIEEVAKHFNGFFDESVKVIYVPGYDGSTRIECINPRLITEEEYERVRQIIKDAETALWEYLHPKKGNN